MDNVISCVVVALQMISKYDQTGIVANEDVRHFMKGDYNNHQSLELV